jgi:hypothetical protein
METVYTLFGNVGTSLFDLFKPLQTIHPEAFALLPKISKGENYLGYPWVMMDYPRHFHQQKGHLALRVFFWWGHQFVILFQVSGQYAGLHPKLMGNPKFRSFVQTFETYMGNPKDPWDNTLPQQGMFRVNDNEYTIKQEIKDYFKIMIPISLEKSEELPEIVFRLGEIILEILQG